MLKKELKCFERHIRVFEQTHLDLTMMLREQVKHKNLNIQPHKMEIKQDVKITDKG